MGAADEAHGSEGLMAGVWSTQAYILATKLSIRGCAELAVVSHGSKLE
jgi:hypothetical protein